MPNRVLPARQYERQAWRNGGGTTAEIWRAPSPDGGFDWRLSMAEVEKDGPFSVFPGIDRFITLIDGHGMILEHHGMPKHRLEKKFVPHAFSGDIATDCRLIDGPCRDLNLMARRDRVAGNLEVRHLTAGLPQTIAGNSVAAIVLTGHVRAKSNDQDLELETGDTLLVDSATTIAATSDSIVAVAMIVPVTSARLN